MSGGLVLITGATGHLGFKTLVFALQAGYNVRAAVRNQGSVDKILAAPSIQALKTDSNLKFTLVQDIIVAAAYDDAIAGVDYVIHCASPITSGITEHFEEKIIAPAVLGTTGMLNSALKTPSVKRLVITSSVLAITPVFDVLSQTRVTFDGDLKVPFKTGPYTSEFEAYCDSKVRALAQIYKILEMAKPKFDVVNLMPSFIIGKNELITSLEDFSKGTNKVVFDQVLGKHKDPLPGATVWLDDIAHLHVQALDQKIPGNVNYLATVPTKFSDAISAINRNFSEEVSKGILSNDGTQPTLELFYNTLKTEDVFGIEFKDVDVQVTDVARHYLELKKSS